MGMKRKNCQVAPTNQRKSTTTPGNSAQGPQEFLKGKSESTEPNTEEVNEARGEASRNLVEFDTEEQAASYDRWFRNKVEASRKDLRPSIQHEEAMARIAANLERRKKTRN